MIWYKLVRLSTTAIFCLVWYLQMRLCGDIEMGGLAGCPSSNVGLGYDYYAQVSTALISKFY
jgi:hypothetical protein